MSTAFGVNPFMPLMIGAIGGFEAEKGEWASTNSPSDIMELRSPATSGSISHSSCDQSQSPMSLGSSVGSPQDAQGHTPVYASLQGMFHGDASNMYGLDELGSELHLMNQLDVSGEPFLKITEEPQDKFRFRYVSEMHGTHGCILGINKTRMKKTYPGVQLVNYTGKAIIRCTLYSVDPANRTMHPHTLVAKIGQKEIPEPHDKAVPCATGYVVDFQNVGIIHTARKNVYEILKEKKIKRKLEEMRPGSKLNKSQENEIKEEAARDTKNVNLNSVCFCYEALVKDAYGALNLLCPRVYSQPIHNMKCALNGELKIVRIDKLAGSCKGGDEIFIFVEKVNKKNIKVRFYELDVDGNEVWEGYAAFNEFDVHKQYGIVFKTPPYRYPRIDKNVEVFLELKRPTDGSISESKRFTYKPQEIDMYGPHRKRPREDFLNNSDNVDNTMTATTLSNPVVPTQPELPVEFLNTAPSQSPLEDYNILPPLVDFEHIPSFTTPSFEQFLYNVNCPEYYNALENEQDTNLVPDATVVRRQTRQNCFIKGEVQLPSTLKVDLPRRGSGSTQLCDTDEQQLELLPKLLEAMDQATRDGTELTKDDICYLLTDRLKMVLIDGSNVFHTAAVNKQCFELKRLTSYLRTYCPEEEYVKFINAKTAREQTPLYLSVLCNQSEMVGELLRAKADMKIETKGKTPVQLAVEQGQEECVELFIKHMEDNYLDHFYPEGRTLLHEAVNKGHLPIVKLLVNAGANPNIPDSSSESTPLHLAVEKEHIEISKFLLNDDRIDVNLSNSSGNTPLHIACVFGGKGSKELCEVLLSADADPHLLNGISAASKIKEKNGDDDYAGLPQVAELNIKEEAPDEDDNQETRGQTAFDLAQDKPDILKLLCSSGQNGGEEDKWEEASSELFSVKDEPLSPTLEDALDPATLLQVADILQRNEAWRDLAVFMGLEGTIPQLEVFTDPARRLLAGCMGQVSTQEMRDLLAAQNQLEAVKCVDAMTANRRTY